MEIDIHKVCVAVAGRTGGLVLVHKKSSSSRLDCPLLSKESPEDSISSCHESRVS